MPRIFEDSETGEKWEEAEDDPLAEPRQYTRLVIRPIKEEPKWRISEPRLFPAADEVSSDTYVMSLGLEVSKDQAQLIKELQEVIMAGIFGDNEHYFDYQVREVYNDARQAFQKGDE